METTLSVGLSVTEDIIFILEKYVSPSLSVKTDTNEYLDLGYEIHKLNEQDKLNAMYSIIRETFKFIEGHKRDMRPVLDDINQSFIRYNV